jgi:hypothetical protein
VAPNGFQERTKSADDRSGSGTDIRMWYWLPWVPIAFCVGALLAMVGIAGFRLVSPAQDTNPFPRPMPPFQPAPKPFRSSSLPDDADPSFPAIRTSTSRQPKGLPPIHVSRTRLSKPVASPVTGHYQVISSYSDAFIGQVLVSNAANAPQGWVVALRSMTTSASFANRGVSRRQWRR